MKTRQYIKFEDVKICEVFDDFEHDVLLKKVNDELACFHVNDKSFYVKIEPRKTVAVNREENDI